MITVQIDNEEIEQTLLSKFKSPKEIKEYFYQLVIEDIEDKKFLQILEEDNKKDYASKEDIFKALDNI